MLESMNVATHCAPLQIGEQIDTAQPNRQAQPQRLKISGTVLSGVLPSLARGEGGARKLQRAWSNGYCGRESSAAVLSTPASRVSARV
jgi:hypothetical protein